MGGAVSQSIAQRALARFRAPGVHESREPEVHPQELPGADRDRESRAEGLWRGRSPPRRVTDTLRRAVRDGALRPTGAGVGAAFAGQLFVVTVIFCPTSFCRRMLGRI